MPHIGFDQLTAEIGAITPVRDVGRVARIGRGSLEVSGLSHVAAQGDLVEIAMPGRAARRGEVLNLTEHMVTVLPDGDIEGLQIGKRP
jgi:flagellum-specific ATP synthase